MVTKHPGNSCRQIRPVSYPVKMGQISACKPSQLRYLDTPNFSGERHIDFIRNRVDQSGGRFFFGPGSDQDSLPSFLFSINTLHQTCSFQRCNKS